MTRGPMKVQASRRRLDDDSHVREGEIPAYFRWDDGSEYEVFHTEFSDDPAQLPIAAYRRWHGPLFGTLLGEWKGESFSW